MKKNGLLTFIFAFVPGWGQMYQGFMRRGLSLMFWFFAVIGVSSLLHTGLPCLLLPIIWAYSFFDTFNLHHLSDEQKMALGDFFLPQGGWMEEITGGQGSGRILGIVILGLGALGLAGFLWNMLTSVLWRIVPSFIMGFVTRIPAILLAAGLVYVGWRVLRSRIGGGTHA